MKVFRYLATVSQAPRAPREDVPEQGPIAVVYAYNPGRAHKILPLLEGLPVVPLRTLRDALKPPARYARAVMMIDTFGRFGVIGLIASLRLRAPLALRLRGNVFRSERERAQAGGGLLRRVRYLANISLMKLCFKKARLVICNSEHLAREIAPRVDADTLLTVVHNPYTPPPSGKGESTEYPDGGLCLLTVTNMRISSKAQPTSEAIANWVPTGLWEELDLRWVVCGDGYHEKELRETVHAKRLESRVRIMGRVDDVADAYDWCDVLVHLTRMDAFPNTPMEAMMHSKPVIINADSDGTREQVFAGENGIIVSDADSFVAALRTYAKDPTLRRRHGQAGKALVEARFSVAAQRGALQKVLRDLCSRELRMGDYFCSRRPW